MMEDGDGGRCSLATVSPKDRQPSKLQVASRSQHDYRPRSSNLSSFLAHNGRAGIITVKTDVQRLKTRIQAFYV